MYALIIIHLIDVRASNRFRLVSLEYIDYCSIIYSIDYCFSPQCFLYIGFISPSFLISIFPYYANEKRV